jgi:flagellar protein FlaG
MNIPTVSNPSLEAQASPRVREDKVASASVPLSSAPRNAPVQGPANANVKQDSARQPSSEQVRDAVKEMNQAMRQSNRGLEFSVDEESERLVVKLTDGETGEVIRQIPSDETLAISRYIADVQQGLLLSQKA